MTTTATMRSHYVREATLTASPMRLLTMLYDRLVTDLRCAQAALANSDVPESHSRLIHAQSIVWELRGSLDTSAWDGAEGLASLYDYVLEQLVAANVNKDVSPVQACLAVVEPLSEAWREAAAAAALEVPA